MSARFKVVIPARYAATRFPGKLLAEISGKPILRHVWEAAQASTAERVIVATDDDRIEEACQAFGAEVMRTSPGHRSGTDRVAEAVQALNEPDTALIVNVQGDELGLPAALIDQVAAALFMNSSASVATLCEAITDPDDLRDEHVVKVVFDDSNNALYFSRAPIPWRGAEGDAAPAWRHIGLYAYRAGFLCRLAAMPPCPLESSERLEQLRALYHGHRIHVEEACMAGGIGIDTPEDLEYARARQRELH